MPLYLLCSAGAVSDKKFLKKIEKVLSDSSITEHKQVKTGNDAEKNLKFFLSDLSSGEHR